MGTEKGLVLYKYKSLILYALETLIPLCDEILISSGNEKFKEFGYEIVPDEIAGIGPMGGIYSCLKRSKNELNLVLSCDMPYVTSDIFNHLLNQRGQALISVPWYEKDHYEPLCGVYHREIVQYLSSYIQKQNFKLPDLFKEIPFFALNINDLQPPLSEHYFFNINKPGDLNTKY